MYNDNRSSQIPALPINKAQKRLYAASSDPTFEHDTLAAMQIYVDTDPTAYLGQILYCKANDTMYRISNNNGRKILTETGIKGPKGDKGEMGPQGPKGEIPNMTEYDNRLDRIDEQLEDSLVFDVILGDGSDTPPITTELTEQIEDINEQLEERVEFETIEGNEINLPSMSTSELMEEVYQINEHLNTNKHEIGINSAAINTIKNQVTHMGSGTPKGVYKTLARLIEAHPSGGSNIYVVAETGGWYYWNGNEWTMGGIYQSTTLENGSIVMKKLDNTLQEQLLKYFDWELGSIDTAGKLSDNNNRARTNVFRLSKGSRIVNTLSGYQYRIAYYNDDNTFKTLSEWSHDDIKVVADSNIAIIVRLAIDGDLSNNLNIIKKGIHAFYTTFNEGECQRINNDLNKLKKDLTTITELNITTKWESKYVNNQLEIGNSGKCILSEPINSGKKCVIKVLNNDYDYKIVKLDKDNNIVSLPSSYTQEETIVNADSNFRIQFHRVDRGLISVEDKDKISIKKSTYGVTNNPPAQNEQSKQDDNLNIKSIQTLYKTTIEQFKKIPNQYTIAEYYKMWDDLMAIDNTITKSQLGTDSAGLPIYKYEMKPMRTHLFYPYLPYEKLPKIVFIGGLHGDEKGSQTMDIRFFSDLVKNWRTNETLRYLKSNIHFIIIPLACPWGFEHHSRTNVNGVNLNRNFATDWTLTDKNYNYSGPEAMSEKETQLIDKLLRDNNDAILVIDSHNTESIQDGNKMGYVRTGIDDRRLHKMMENLFRAIDLQVRCDYPMFEQEKESFQTKNMFSVGIGKSGGTLSRHYSAMGITGVLSEKVDKFGYQNSYSYNELSDIGVNTIGNLILMALINSKF